ncbi:hypothetical protein [Pseudidiomarina terrestris]|uniref:Uncharacterized protein n=1 Tax=Pseudidiomarina terrestris TaxID=2820060 RepID=A0AAW7QZW6_9GAMM|nr:MULTISPECIES: hypothetical protein [unclassified Pseudidiomarina]MDN7125413.1 hypothetical protein [Pseudidiomarina sp. 1APP75-32.1]MDN7128017.1 hypothetical protein [Pseudidiomarina sp. 1APR75-33.1]MDN7130171.1 hypothetical protein [Pseudidiomarina sp. 1APR75-15]MDN7135676.1 hypothetical protein [Pseudidiomarina sp. 1ASP75-5]MDN7137286.1 hypothetical protein [Pseudidiomarina sp. 1ASP75-14]
MSSVTKRTPERRRGAFEPTQWWERLSMDQKFGVYQLSKFGFELAFIRNLADAGPLAVVRRQRDYATVNHAGEVNMKPQITIRD